MPARKKIFIVVTKGDLGGAQVFVRNLARGLASFKDGDEDGGFDVTVGMGDGGTLTPQLERDGIRVIRFKHLRRAADPFAMISFIFEMRSFLEREHFDAVQFNSSNSLPGAMGVKLADKAVKTIFTVHGLSVLDEHYRAPFLKGAAYRIFFKLFLPYVDVPVFVAQHDLEAAHATGLVAQSRGTVIYNGLDGADLRFMEKSAARAALENIAGRNLSRSFVVGSIGRLSYQKNYQFLIRAFPELLKEKPDAIAVLVGDGPERSQCQTLIQKLGLADKVVLAGGMPDASQYLKGFDLFVLPSRYEGLPITLTECLFAGVPVIASDVGGNREVVRGRSLYKLDDGADFIKKFSDALRDPASFVPDASLKERFRSDTTTAAYAALFS